MFTQPPERENLCQLIKDYGNDPYCLELIQFFGWHPSARFSCRAILHSLGVNCGRHYIEKALHQLVDKGVVTTYSENDILLYCLTDDKPLRQTILEITRLDWSQWQVMLRQSHSHLWDYIKQIPGSLTAVTNA
jgi:hypothetical protein